MTPPPGLPPMIGRFRVLELLGRGAMGVVYRGIDEILDRPVALKVMAGHGIETDARMRFRREAQAAAKLQHPNIITIYELGDHQGAPFMALELLEGAGPAARHRGRHPPRSQGNAAGDPANPGGPRARPRARHRPPRHQALEHLPAAATACEDHGLRRRTPRGRRDHGGHGHRHAELHVARAGAGRRPGWAQRPVLRGPHALRARDRREGVPRRLGSGADVQDRPHRRRPVADPERPGLGPCSLRSATRAGARGQQSLPGRARHVGRARHGAARTRRQPRLGDGFGPRQGRAYDAAATASRARHAAAGGAAGRDDRARHSGAGLRGAHGPGNG